MQQRTFDWVSRAPWGVVAFALAACGEGTLPPPTSADPEPSTSEMMGGVDSLDDPATMPDGAGGSPPEDLANQVPDCVMPAAALESVVTPSPLISIGMNVTASAGVTTAERAVDGLYRNGGSRFGRPTPEAPEQIAFEVGEGPSSLLLLWTDATFTNYNAALGSPADYLIEVSSDSTDGVDGVWAEVVNVADNPVRSRAHRFDFSGRSWVRFVVTGAPEGASPVLIDEIAIHDVSAAAEDRPLDTWFFMGDSIIMGAFMRSFGQGNFERQLNELRPGYDPIAINGGIGGELVTQGIGHLSEWLSLNPDFLHIVIAYGTNDAWGNQNVANVGFEDNLKELSQAVLDAGRIPILARIPFASSGVHETLPDFNAVIQSITEDLGLPCGADVFSYFEANPEQLGPDGVHPSMQGYGSMNQLWAETVASFYPEP